MILYNIVPLNVAKCKITRMLLNKCVHAPLVIYLNLLGV